MKSEYFEKLMGLLSDVTRSVNILTIAQKLTEASSDEERIYLSQALSHPMQSDGFQSNNGNFNNGFHNEQSHS